MFCAMGLLNTMEDSSPCNSTPMNLQGVKDRLDCIGSETAVPMQKENRKAIRADRGKRQARLDRQLT